LNPPFNRVLRTLRPHHTILIPVDVTLCPRLSIHFTARTDRNINERAAHDLTDLTGHVLSLILRDFRQHLVMNRQQQVVIKSCVAQGDEGLCQNVSCSALNRVVYGCILSSLIQREEPAMVVHDIATISALLSLKRLCVRGKLVVCRIILCDSPFHSIDRSPCLPRQRLSTASEDFTESNTFTNISLELGKIVSIDQASRIIMQVNAICNCVLHLTNVSESSKHSKLDLIIVCTNDYVPFLRNNLTPDHPRVVTSRWKLLKSRVTDAHTGRSSLKAVDVRVDTTERVTSVQHRLSVRRFPFGSPLSARDGPHKLLDLRVKRHVLS